MSDTSTVETPSEVFTGRVKWFNNKTGFGFITVTDGSKSGTDLFAHHSAIKVETSQYKYLVQGEYLEFNISSSTNEKHEFQATNISGIKGGKLMCETRNENKTQRVQHKTGSSSESLTESH